MTYPCFERWDPNLAPSKRLTARHRMQQRFADLLQYRQWDEWLLGMAQICWCFTHKMGHTGFEMCVCGTLYFLFATKLRPSWWFLSGVGGGHFQPRIPSTIHQPSSAYTKDGKENCDLLQLFLASNQIHITFSGQIRQLPRIDDRRFAERHHDVKSPKKNIARIRGELDRRSWSGDIGATWYQADIAWDDGHQWLQVHHATSQWVQVV